jgi:ATP-dependent protease ClpP protease subunit
LIEKSKIPIFTVAIDVVYSGFFYILQAGQKRFATPNTKLTFHRAIKFFDNKEMNAADLYKEADFLSMLDGAQIHVFYRRGRSIESARRFFRVGATLTATGAKKLKLVDEIIEKDTMLRMCVLVRRKIAHNT